MIFTQCGIQNSHNTDVDVFRDAFSKKRIERIERLRRDLSWIFCVFLFVCFLAS